MANTKNHRMVLEHLDGARKGEVEVYLRETLTIGRAIDCDLHFPNEKSTSPHHAVVRAKMHDGQITFELQDTQSTNGTFINGHLVEQAQLKIGDVIRFGVLGPQVKFGVQVLETNDDGMESRTPRQVQTSAKVEPTWRYVRNAAMLYIGGSVAAVSVADAVFDRYALNAKWFSVFLIFLLGGLVSTLVEAWYRAAPGRQKFQWWEAAVHLAILLICVLTSVVVFHLNLLN